MTEDSVILLERKFIKASVVTYFTAFIVGILISALLWSRVDHLNAAEFWIFWPLNLRYISQITAHFGSIDGWNGFLFSNYVISSIMIIRIKKSHEVELVHRRKQEAELVLAGGDKTVEVETSRNARPLEEDEVAD